MLGYASAMAMLDQPVPQATSRTRAGGSARSRTSRSTIAGSHSVPSKLMNLAWFGLPPGPRAPMVGRRSVPNPKRLHQLWQLATGTDDVDAGVSLVSDIVAICQDGDVPGGNQYRRASGSARGSSTPSSSLAAWCSSHSRTYRSVVQCVRPAATRWPHRLLRVPDTARVVHRR